MTPLLNCANAMIQMLQAAGAGASFAPGSVIIRSGPNGLTAEENTPAPAFMPVRFAGFVLQPGPTVLFDEEGFPKVLAGSTGVFQTNPTTIAQWGLGGYARGDYRLAQKAADWLCAKQTPAGGFPLNFNHTNNPTNTPPGKGYRLTAPWLSAITQGNAIALLVRLYRLTGDGKYRTAATLALKPLDTPVAQGGVKGSLNGGVWFEETPDPTYPNHIFNGSVFALLGIHELVLYTGDTDATRLWQQGEQSLRNNINAHIVWAPLHPQAPSYLPDPWGIYDQQVEGFPAIPNYVTDFYMQVHCELIEEMATRTGQAIYAGTAAALRQSLAAYLAGTAAALRQSLAAYLAGTAAALRQSLAAYLAGTAAALRQSLAAYLAGKPA